MTNKLFTSFLTLFCFLTPSNNIRYSSQSITYDKSDVVADLESDSSFNFDDYKKNEEVKDEDAIKDITLINSSNSLYLYLFNENAKRLELNLTSVRISLSFTEDYSDTNYYFGVYLNKSDDNLFYKFKFDSPIKSSNITEVHIADIEFDYGQGFPLGRHNTIGSSYYYEEGKSNPVEKKELEVVNLSITPGNYRFGSLNENSTIDEEHYWDLFYITFSINDDYGDIVGIKMTWDEINYDQIYQNGSSGLDDKTTYCYDNVLEFKSTDLQNITSLANFGNGWDKFLVNLNPMHWFWKQDGDHEIPAIEKVKYEAGSVSKFDGYYFNDETIQFLNSQYWTLLQSNSSNYVIRFTVKDFCNYNFGGYHHNIKTVISNCDVLTLTFLKDGKTYSLMASSKPVNYDPGNEIPDREDPDWLTKIKQFISTILLVVLICVTFPIIVNIIIPICKLIFKVISLPFKAISKAVKKKKNKNKKE